MNPFCIECTLGLLPCLTYKAKWVQLNGKILQVLKTSLVRDTINYRSPETPYNAPNSIWSVIQNFSSITLDILPSFWIKWSLPGSKFNNGSFSLQIWLIFIRLFCLNFFGNLDLEFTQYLLYFEIWNPFSGWTWKCFWQP